MASSNLPDDYHTFSIELMNRCHDSLAVLDLVLASEDPELDITLDRAVRMAYERIYGVIGLLDGSQNKYNAKKQVTV